MGISTHGDFELLALGIAATATGRTGLAETTDGVRSQTRRLLSSEPRPFAGAIPATRIGLELLPAPLTRCRTPLVSTGLLLIAATGFAMDAAICDTGCAGPPAGGADGPVATVSTTPVAV